MQTEDANRRLTLSNFDHGATDLTDADLQRKRFSGEVCRLKESGTDSDNIRGSE